MWSHYFIICYLNEVDKNVKNMATSRHFTILCYEEAKCAIFVYCEVCCSSKIRAEISIANVRAVNVVLKIYTYIYFFFKCWTLSVDRFLTICTSNCKYEVVRRVASRFGMREVTEDSSWNLYWTDLSVSIERAKDMKRFQKVNHFPGMTEICRKDLLARNLNRMLRLFPKDYNFFPKTWCFPAE